MKIGRPIMRWRICQCEVNGLKRPDNGPIKIKSTDIVGDGVLKARLAGPTSPTAHTVKVSGRYFYVTRDRDRQLNAREVPADSLTDALHAGVFMQNEEVKHKKQLRHRKRPMPHVDVRKINKAVKAGRKR